MCKMMLDHDRSHVKCCVGVNKFSHPFVSYNMVIAKSEKVIIVGAGSFGVSTAYHLLQRGFTDVTIMDRSPTLPALDAASTDLNRSQSPCSIFDWQVC